MRGTPQLPMENHVPFSHAPCVVLIGPLEFDRLGHDAEVGVCSAQSGQLHESGFDDASCLKGLIQLVRSEVGWRAAYRVGNPNRRYPRTACPAWSHSDHPRLLQDVDGLPDGAPACVHRQGQLSFTGKQSSLR